MNGAEIRVHTGGTRHRHATGALAAATCYATVSALQHYEARRSSPGDTVAVGGMLSLVRQSLWLVGVSRTSPEQCCTCSPLAWVR